jgi:transposase
MQRSQRSRPVTIIRIGLDTAKHVFQVHGVDENEQTVVLRQLRRSEMGKFFNRLAPTRIGLEACRASHYWARLLRGLGHEVVLLPPKYIKPYVKRGKNDANDVEAICEAMSRPGMRFVPIKSAESQAELMLPGVRDLLIKQRTAVINTIRGYAAEFGVIAPKGPVKVAELLQQAHAEEANVPALALDMLRLLAAQLDALDVKLKLLETRLMALHRENPLSDETEALLGIEPFHCAGFLDGYARR